MAELIYKDEVYAIIGAAQEVYYQIGTGFLEAVYQEALGIEMLRRKISFESQKQLFINYKGTILKKEYYADFVCDEKIIVELKAESALCGRDVSQLLNYMKAEKNACRFVDKFRQRRQTRMEALCNLVSSI